ncbi:MAG: toll/interleukin-1 receptor domain-containing protein, partial [Dehalococcoidia bacterium]
MNGNESPFELPDEVERCLATLSKMYEKRGDTKLEKIIVNAKPLVQEMTTTGSWNDGSAGHTLHLIVPASIFPSSVEEKTKSEISILNDINKIHHVQNEYIESVRLQMDTQTAVDWRQQSGLQIADKRVIAVSTTDRIWGRAGYFRVFLSHKSEVKEETAKLKEKLKIYGITCFVAHTDIEPTKEWQTEIENALHSMDALIALLTDDFHNSDWTDQEVGFAFGRSVPIIPVKLGRDPYGFMGKFQA